ncbi:MAG: CD225/dispanin family protein [Muribaculaceae bacterium]|nr:CD225/dispanin family protein [Muribaculaceae bacterium]
MEEYWIVVNDTHAGPYTAEQLRGSITPDTYVWYRGLPQWVFAKEVPELAALFEAPVSAAAQPEPQPVVEEQPVQQQETVVTETFVEESPVYDQEQVEQPVMEQESAESYDNYQNEQNYQPESDYQQPVAEPEYEKPAAADEYVEEKIYEEEQPAAYEESISSYSEKESFDEPEAIVTDFAEESEVYEDNVVEEKEEFVASVDNESRSDSNPSSAAWWKNLAQAEAEAEAEAERFNGRHHLTCPPRYLVWAIITTLIFCLPLGVVAIVFSSKVRRLYNSGDYEGAVKASERTAWWSNVAFVVGLIWLPFQIVFTMIAS